MAFPARSRTVLSAPALASLDGSNALILTAPPKGGKAAAKQARAQEQQQRALSKAEQRKLKQVQLKKERRDGLEQVGLCCISPYMHWMAACQAAARSMGACGTWSWRRPRLGWYWCGRMQVVALAVLVIFLQGRSCGAVD
jgi:hypothetical protein